jgi:5-hydroxyisourate hydrolase
MTPDPAALSLSLHVLDTARGRAGSGLAFSLSRIDADGGRALLAAGETDSGGRWGWDPSAHLSEGTHDFVFDVGTYQAAFGTPGFYDVIAIRFLMQPTGGHYHIPLILSPFGYSTYRGG